MDKNWKNRKRFIRDWAIIWIWCVSLVVFANVMVCIQVYTKKCEDELLDKFETYCVEILEKETFNYDR